MRAWHAVWHGRHRARAEERPQAGAGSEGPPAPETAGAPVAAGGGTTGGRSPWLQLGVVCIASFIIWTGFGAIIPYLPIFMKEQAHSSMTMIGVIAATFYVGMLLFSSPFGWLSDRVGRKPLIVAGVALYTVAMLLFTTTLEPIWFVAFRFLEGMGAAAVGPAGQAFIADITPQHNRSKAYGIYTTAQFGGLVVGPALAWPVYSAFGEGLAGFYAIFYAGAIGAAAATVALFVLIREPQRQPAAAERASAAEHGEAAGRQAEGGGRLRYREVLTPAILAFVLVAFAMHFVMGAFEVVWSIRLRDLGATLSYVSLTFTVFSIPMLLSFAGGILADRYSRFALMFGGYAVAGTAWIVYGTTESFGVILVFSAIEGLAIALAFPAKQAFLMQVSPPDWRGTVVGLETTSTQLAGLISSLIAPLMYQWMSGYVLAVGGVISLLGLVVAAPPLYREWRRLAAAPAD